MGAFRAGWPLCVGRTGRDKLKQPKDKKTKMSTLVTGASTVQFQIALGNVLRANMDGLKRPKKKGEKGKKGDKVPVKKDMESPKKEAAKAAAKEVAKAAPKSKKK